MGLGKRLFGGLLITGVAMLAAPPCASTQERVGIVTNLEGLATVTRVALTEPRQLQFKDNVYVRDRITTGERSIVRVLLGGKATVTARERSVLTITELPGVSTIDLSVGRISVAVSKGLMKHGEIVEIKTPNAIAAVRGTIVIAEVSLEENFRSTISVLRGLVDVTRLDQGRRVGPSVNVGALRSVTVVGSRLPTQPSTVSSEQAKRLTSDFRIVPTQVARAATVPAVRHAMERAAEHAKAAVAAGPRTPDGESDAGAQDANRDASGKDGDRDAGRGKDSGNAYGKEPKKGSGNGNDFVEGGSGALSTLAMPPSAIDSTIGTASAKKGKK